MFHVLYYLCLNVKFCATDFFAVEDKEEMYNENLRSQENVKNTLGTIRYSNRIMDAIIDSCK